MAAVTPGGWGLNVGGFIDAHPDWLIRGRASGYTAQRKDKDGRPRGLVLEARTLDELAALIETAGQS